ncbi:MMPL family transporter [Gordonia sp. NPDC003424]
MAATTTRHDRRPGVAPLTVIGRWALRGPWWIVAGALAVMVATGLFGAPVAHELSNGGFQDPAAESSRASDLMAHQFGIGGTQLAVTVEDRADGAMSPAARADGTEITRRLDGLPYVTGLQSAWAAPPQSPTALISRDGRIGLVVAGLTGDETTAQRHAADIQAMLPTFDGVTVRTGGAGAALVATVDQSKKDLAVMETIAMPLSFVILIWVFGGVFAAALPLVVGMFAIVGSMAVLRGIAAVTDVSIFALNLVLAMGLALAIDYTLLIVNRFRTELAENPDRERALLITMSTAGRTVAFSAVTVALAMATMVCFPIYFLKSFAYAGVAVVALAAGAALVLTPAVLVLLGTRLDAWDLRRLIRRVLGRPAPTPAPIDQTAWYRWSKGVMRRAIPVALGVTVALLAAGAPFLGIKFGFPDDRLLPPSADVRQVGDQLRSEFDTAAVGNSVVITVPNVAGLPVGALDGYAADLSRVADVSAVSVPSGTYRGGHRVGPAALPTEIRGDAAYLTVGSVAPLYSPASEHQLDHLHAVTPPDGRQVLFGGWAQLNRDSGEAVTSTLPLVVSLIAAVTFVIVFLFTGSLVLPVVTLLLNVLSLTAAFGALVWIFQDGHLGGFGTTTIGTLSASVPMLLFCMAFGLAMDYQLFVVSRMREYWAGSAKTRADNTEAIARGLAHTGRVVTAAALLMVVTFGSMGSAQVSIMRVFGVGLPLAVLVDATLVRMVLLPAVMGLLGRFSWWAPAPLAWLHQHVGLRESAPVRAIRTPDLALLARTADVE